MPGPRMTSTRLGQSVPPARRAACAATAGAAAGTLAAVLGPWWLGPLVAWDVAAAAQLVWTWLLIWGLSPSETSSHATQESPGRANTDLLLVAGSIVSLVAVGLVLVKANQHSGLDRGILIGTSVLSIVLAWSTVHTVYALRYAQLYYRRDAGGVDFNDDSSAPCYPDFVYLALTIGMTFQVSDTDLTTTGFRRLAIRHALLSYMFGALIIAVTINLIAGLGH